LTVKREREKRTVLTLIWIHFVKQAGPLSRNKKSLALLNIRREHLVCLLDGINLKQKQNRTEKKEEEEKERVGNEERKKERKKDPDLDSILKADSDQGVL
jgi:hypothetical protein